MHGNFCIDIFGAYGKAAPFWNQIANLLQKGFVLGKFELSTVLAMPLVYLCLQLVTLVQEGFIFGPELSQDSGETGPESGFTDTSTWQDRLIHKIVNWFGNL